MSKPALNHSFLLEHAIERMKKLHAVVYLPLNPDGSIPEIDIFTAPQRHFLKLGHALDHMEILSKQEVPAINVTYTVEEVQAYKPKEN